MSSEYENSTEEMGIVPRPIQVLNELSPRYKWEFTRRHPYYLLCWQQARGDHQGGSEAEQMMRSAAKLILQQIGITSETQPPSQNAEELGLDAVPSPWKEGAIASVSVRTIVTTLAGVLPPETKRVIADLLKRSAEVDMQNLAEAYPLIQEMTQAPHPNFDAHLPSLFVTINPQAPLRAVTEAVEQIVREYKAAHGIPEHRRREDKLDEYLQVWDLREGWTGEGYDSSRELTLKEIGQQLSLSIRTVANRYQSAFRCIVGHDYSAALWARVLGLVKLHGILGGHSPRLAARRPWRTRQPREVPESVLAAPGGDDGRSEHGRFLETAGVSPDTLDHVELSLDIQSLIGLGRGNQQIIDELELTSDDASELIEYMRKRHEDGL